MRTMTRSRMWSLAAVIAAAVLAVPAAAAGAQTYCVHQSSSCAAGQKDDGADLQKALEEAAKESGATVLIGAGTYSRGQGFVYFHGASGSGVTISGAGAGQTIIESSPSEPASGFVFRFEADSTSMLAGVTIHVRAADGNGLLLEGATASGIAVATDTGGPGTQRALFLGAGATVAHSTIEAETDTTAACCAITVYDGSGEEGTLLDDTLVGGDYALDITEPGTKVTARDLRVQSETGGVIASSGSLIIDDMLALLSPQVDESGFLVYSGGSLTMRSATMLGAGASAESKGLQVGDSTSKMTVQDSIVRGFGTPWMRNSGTPTLKLENDDIGAGKNNGTGEPTLSANIDADPLFVDPAGGDYHLRFGSPAIDSGGECLAVCLTVPDLDGLAHPIDGNGDGVAVRDIGAYEYGHRAPSVTASASTAAPPVGTTDTFTAAAVDPDPGDAVSFSWVFDDGALGSGAGVDHAFATPGAHTATVTATDPSGLAATATVTIDVRADPAGKPNINPDTNAAAKPDTKIKKAKIGTSAGIATFTFGAVGQASGFQCELRRAHSHRKPKFVKCRSPKTYKHLQPGHYTFEVRALGAAGQDPTPAKHAFRLKPPATAP